MIHSQTFLKKYTAPPNSISAQKNKCAASNYSQLKKQTSFCSSPIKKKQNPNPFPTLISHHPSLTLNDEQQSATIATPSPATRDATTCNPRPPRRDHLQPVTTARSTRSTTALHRRTRRRRNPQANTNENETRNLRSIWFHLIPPFKTTSFWGLKKNPVGLANTDQSRESNAISLSLRRVYPKNEFTTELTR